MRREGVKGGLDSLVVGRALQNPGLDDSDVLLGHGWPVQRHSGLHLPGQPPEDCTVFLVARSNYPAIGTTGHQGIVGIHVETRLTAVAEAAVPSQQGPTSSRAHGRSAPGNGRWHWSHPGARLHTAPGPVIAHHATRPQSQGHRLKEQRQKPAHSSQHSYAILK